MLELLQNSTVRCKVIARCSNYTKLERGLRQALNDVQPERAFIVYSGADRYPKAGHVEAISLRDLATELAALSAPAGSRL